MEAFYEKMILDSWEKNVYPWTKAIHEKQIESRKLVTDQAIINAVASLSASKILDIGCGEGWLARELSSRGLFVTGIDAVKGLVDKATEHGEGDFRVLEYEDISLSTLGEPYDVAVCNFSLFGKESVEHVFNAIPEFINDGGHFIIQTLHPHVGCSDSPYIDGWRKGSWSGFSKEFVDPAPWYYRTMESWFELYINNGLNLIKIEEPINSQTGKVASLLMIGGVAT